MVFDSDDRNLITAELGGTVRRWAVNTGHQRNIWKILPLPGRRVGPIGLDFYGETLATVDLGDTPIKLWDTQKLWDADSAQPIPSATLTGHTDDIEAAAFSRNGLLATASKDGIVRMWDLKLDSVANRFCRIIGTTSEEQKEQLRSFVLFGFSGDLICG